MITEKQQKLSQSLLSYILGGKKHNSFLTSLLLFNKQGSLRQTWKAPSFRARSIPEPVKVFTNLNHSQLLDIVHIIFSSAISCIHWNISFYLPIALHSMSFNSLQLLHLFRVVDNWMSCCSCIIFFMCNLKYVIIK